MPKPVSILVLVEADHGRRYRQCLLAQFGVGGRSTKRLRTNARLNPPNQFAEHPQDYDCETAADHHISDVGFDFVKVNHEDSCVDGTT